MEEQTTPSPEYLKGFNEGYVLAKNAPALADKLDQVKSDNERIKGFHDGRRQLVLEKVLEQRKGLTAERPSKKDRDKSIEKDNDIER